MGLGRCRACLQSADCNDSARDHSCNSSVCVVPDRPELESLEPVDKGGAAVHWPSSQIHKEKGSKGFLAKRIPLASRIAKGAFGVVWRARNVDTGELLAVKCVKLSKITKSTPRECEIAELIRSKPHPCIVRIHSVHYFNDERLYALVMELCSQGTLTKRIARQRARAMHAVPPESKQYSAPQDTCYWLGQVFIGLEHLHLNCEALLRDLKSDNVVLDGCGNAKITDFGFGKSAQFSRGWTFGNPTGTPGYIAPEIVKCEAHSFRADLFSYGVLAWLLFTGGVRSEVCPQPPTGFRREQPDFRSLEDDWQKLATQAQLSTFGASAEVATHARDLVLRLVLRDPAERLNHEEIRGHPLFSSMGLPPRDSGAAGVEAWLLALGRRTL